MPTLMEWTALRPFRVGSIVNLLRRLGVQLPVAAMKAKDIAVACCG